MALIVGTKVTLNKQCWVFGPNLPKSGFSWFFLIKKTVNNTTEFCIFKLFYLPKLTLSKQFWAFGSNLPKREFFLFKKVKVNITIQFCTFELFKIRKFTLNEQFWVFEINLPRKGHFDLKQKRWTSLLNSAHLNELANKF